MATKEERDRFASEMAQRFDDFVKWSIENWPDANTPLLNSDFDKSRKEMQLILGEKLHEGQDNDPPDPLPPQDQNIQYLPLNPAPWP